MLQSLRSKFMGWPGVIIFGGLGLLMAVGFGVGSYSVSSRDTWVAKVGDHEISTQAYQTQMNNMRRRMSQTQGENFDPAYFQKPEVKQQIVDSMIDRYLLQKSGKDLGMTVTTAAVRQQIASIPSFQVNGKFDPATYRAVLTSNRLTPVAFQQQVRSDLETKLLPSTVAATSTISDADVDDYLKLQLQTRDLHYVVLPRPPLESTKVSDDEVAQYYKAHQSAFMIPERVAIKYIELDASKFKTDEKVDDATLKARYEQEKNRFVEPEQRLVSHILIKVPANATPEQQKQALEKAKMVDAKARAKGADFAALAKKYSDDIGSAIQGGQLGWLQKGVTNKAFEDAMFSMTKGQISDPVLTPDGYDIIWLRGVRAGDVKPFSEVRDQLLTEVKQSNREHEYSELAGKLTDLVYKNPASLEAPAEKLGLKIEKTGLFGRDGAKKGLAANPAVVKAAFSDNVLEDGNTSDPISLGSNHMVVIHVVEHKQERPKPLASVSDTIRQKILDERVEHAAKKHAKVLFAKLQKGKDLSALAKGDKLAVQQLDGAQRRQPGVKQALLDKAFMMPRPEDKQPSFGMVSLGDGSYALLALDAVHPGKVDKVPKFQRQMLLSQMRQAYAATSVKEWLKMLKGKTDIQVSTKRM
ncbi:MAG TPA: SurA N-terminal domain-containing protein [Oleiagrimonas sp.]|nr:SurA N-terminal domain-containing protein [Oleiagrimonas sp.]